MSKKLPQILVVDDDPVIRKMTRESLCDAGFSVEEAVNGKSGVEKFRRLRPDIVLMDVDMPVMNGFEACQHIRNMPEGKFVPILMVTGAGDNESIQKAYDAGATDFITKPVTWMILTQRIRYMLRASRVLQRLKISETRLASVQKLARVGGWELDPQTKQFVFSDQTSEIYGLPPKGYRVPYEHFLRFVHPDDRRRISHFITQSIHIGKPFSVDHRIRLPDGSERIVSQQVKTPMLTRGNKNWILGTIQDVTERKKAEILESDRNAILELIIQNAPLSTILRQLVKVIDTQDSEAGSVIAVAKDGCLEVAAFSRLPESFIAQINNENIGTDSWCMGIAAYIGDTVIVTDVQTHPLCQHHRELLGVHGIQSYFASPVISGKGQLLGTVIIFHHKPYPPSDRDLALITSVGKLAAIAIEKSNLTDKLEHQARHDTLTGLPNRASASEYLEHALARAARYQDHVAILFIDLDRFKNVNDSLGHHIGDILLKQIAERFKACTRNSDILARMGGDEFVYVLNGVDGRDGAVNAANRILESLNTPFEIDRHTLHISASIGISLFPEDGPDPITLQKNADAAMYAAKNAGGNRTHWFTSEIKAATVERLELENELRNALENGHFELHYQPQYTLKDEKLIGFEALLRWNHPEYGRISPVKFIPIAEESGLIIPIGAWVLAEACRQNRAWQLKGYGFFRVAVNVSIVQIMQEDFVETVRKTLEETDLQSKWLELELTESIIANDFKSMVSRLEELQKLGVEIAIDDFGTGYSSMSYLHHLPVNCLKIDQSFVKEIMRDTSERIRTMIKTLIELARSLHLKVIAEGVENNEQFEFLKQIGCEIGQGFYFNVPMAAKEVRFDSAKTSMRTRS